MNEKVLKIEDDRYVKQAYHDCNDYIDAVNNAAYDIGTIVMRADRLFDSLTVAYERGEFEYHSHYVSAVRQLRGLVSRAVLETIAQKGAV